MTHAMGLMPGQMTGSMRAAMTLAPCPDGRLWLNNAALLASDTALRV